jgi:hypothetical protein
MLKAHIKMKRRPNFFLTTAGEYSALADPRACYELGRLKDENRDDYMLVEIEPSLSGQNFGLGGHDINYLILSTKLKGTTLFQIKEWPVSVYVTRILDESILKKVGFTASQVELIAWGFLYPTIDKATATARKL